MSYFSNQMYKFKETLKFKGVAGVTEIILETLVVKEKCGCCAGLHTVCGIRMVCAYSCRKKYVNPRVFCINFPKNNTRITKIHWLGMSKMIFWICYSEEALSDVNYAFYLMKCLRCVCDVCVYHFHHVHWFLAYPVAVRLLEPLGRWRPCLLAGASPQPKHLCSSHPHPTHTPLSLQHAQIHTYTDAHRCVCGQNISHMMRPNAR